MAGIMSNFTKYRKKGMAQGPSPGRRLRAGRLINYWIVPVITLCWFSLPLPLLGQAFLGQPILNVPDLPTQEKNSGELLPEGKPLAETLWMPRTAPDSTGLWDNLSAFVGLDGSKGPEDLESNENFGWRAHFNWGIPLVQSWGLGFQVGSAINYSRAMSNLFENINGTRDRLQSFTTVGLFQRSSLGLNWGVVYDFLSEHYYTSINLGQVRGQVGYQTTANDEIGLWGALRTGGDVGSLVGRTIDFKPMTQANLFWRHVFDNNTQTRIWLGVADEHTRYNFLAPGDPPIHHPFIFGGDMYVPLNNYWGIFGQANFVTPGTSGTVAAFVGLVFYPAGQAGSATRNPYAPYLPLANNPTFVVNAFP